MAAGPDNSPIADSQRVAARIDSVVFATFFLAVAMPFSRFVFVNLGIIQLTGFDIIYYLVICLLLLKIAFLGKIRLAGMVAFFTLTVGAYIVGSVALGDATLHDALGQARVYCPFAIAVLLLAAGTSIDLRKFFRYAAGATIISASSALILHFVFNLYVVQIYGDSHETLTLSKIARLRWDNETAMLFIILYFVVRGEHSRINRFLAGSALLIGTVTNFISQTRTLLAGLMVFFVGSIFISKGRHEAVRRLGQLLGFLVLFGAVIGALLMADSRARAVAYSRLLGGGGGAQMLYQRDLVIGRMSNYQQYWKSITEHFPWGQGFGLPYSTLGVMAFPVTDISLMAFLLPLGVLGVVMFGLFIRALWRTATRTSDKLPPEYGRSIKLLIVVALLMSANMDIFSRDNFVVLLALLIMCAGNSSAQVPARESITHSTINALKD
jgi:hypothetical protein